MNLSRTWSRRWPEAAWRVSVSTTQTLSGLPAQRLSGSAGQRVSRSARRRLIGTPSPSLRSASRREQGFDQRLVVAGLLPTDHFIVVAIQVLGVFAELRHHPQVERFVLHAGERLA